MQLAIALSLAACFCTATGSVCQRLGATNLEQSRAQAGGFDPWLVFRLARQSAWLLGFACMIAGFVFQVAALRFGPLDPVTATLLGVLLYDEHLATSPAALTAELLSLLVLAVGARALSHSPLIAGPAEQ